MLLAQNIGVLIMRIRLSLAAIAIAVTALTVVAQAEGPVIANTTADLNMRAGPGTGHRVILTVPRGGRVTVNGCTASYSWCDATFGNVAGWVSSDYLISADQGRFKGQPIAVAARSLGVPVTQKSRPAPKAGPVHKNGPVYKGDPVPVVSQAPGQVLPYDPAMYPFATPPCPRYPDRYFEHQVC